MDANQTQGGPGPVAEGDYNPFDQGNMATGGGLWDGKKVTITRAYVGTEALVYADGKPVMDARTRKQSIQIGLFLCGIAEGEEKERKQPYGCGDKLQPDTDGESLSSKDGSPVKFHVNSGVGKLISALTSAGYPVKELLAVPAKYPGQQRWSGLVGAQLTFKAETKLGPDGKPIKDKKGYDKQNFFPVKFEGRVAGAVVAPGAGNGAAASAAASAVAARAEALVLEALAAAGAPVGRAQLVQQLAQKLAGDAESNAIIALIVRDDFHKGRPWKYDGVTATL